MPRRQDPRPAGAAAQRSGTGGRPFRRGRKVRRNFARPRLERPEMMRYRNQLGQPVGFPVHDWTSRQPPSHSKMPGRFCRVAPLDPARHARDLHAANSEDRDGRIWTYLPWGPYAGFADYLAALEAGLRRQYFVTY